MNDPIEEQRHNFNRWLKRSGKSLLAVATSSGVSESGLRSFKTGKTRDLKQENKLKIAEAHGLRIEDIFGTLPQMAVTSRVPAATDAPAFPPGMATTTVPVYGRVDRGQLFITTNPVAFVDAPAGMTLSGNVFAVRMPNATMAPRFRLREILLADPDDAVDNGDEAVIIDTAGVVHILRCMENNIDHGFTGTPYADPTRKTTIPYDKITRIARIVGILMGA
ncbi:MAG: hypothetical protein ABID63_18430 [Pseudomonadota bacterium]